MSKKQLSNNTLNFKAHNNQDLEDLLSSLTQSSKYDDSYSILAGQRMLFLSEDITKNTASELTAMLLTLNEQSPKEEITIFINSRGGDSSALTNIYDIMQQISAPIRTVCLGMAYSAAAILLAAGTPGSRFITRHSKVMIHGIQAIFPYSDKTDSEIYFNFLKNHNKNILKLIADHTNNSLSQVEEDCKRDYYMNAQEAIKYGIVDGIFM